MKRLRITAFQCLTLCLGVLAAPATAQPSQPAPADMSGPYSIAGGLVNALTGEPLRHATIEAISDEDGHAVASCLTDNEGNFSLDRLAAAKYELSASKRGFIPANYDQHDEYSSAIVTGPDQDTTHLHFKLTPEAALRGVVTSDVGDPVANARIMLFIKPRHPGAGERMRAGETTVTDDTGAYEFSNLAVGEYFMAVIAEPWYAVHEGSSAKRNASLDVVFPVTYFDSTTEETSATPIVLAGGSREEANLTLHAVPALRITIAVPRKPDGSITMPELQQTIFGTAVSAQNAASGDALRSGVMQMDGIAPGHYQLTQGDPPRVVDLDLSANQQIDPTLGSPANPVAGRLFMQSGASPPDDATVSLERVDNSPGQPVYATDAHQGQFAFEGVPSGEWAVAVTSGNRALPVIAVAAGATRRAGNLVTLRERAPRLTVTLSDSETDVTGFARKEGEGVAGAMIVLLPRNPAQWRALTRRDQSDSDGSFALHNVVPGDYTLIAIADGWELDWTSPDVMARYLPGGTNVRVSESSGKLVHLNAPVAVQER